MKTAQQLTKFKSKILFLLPTILPLTVIACTYVETNSEKISQISQKVANLKQKFSTDQKKSSQEFQKLISEINSELENLGKILSANEKVQFKEKSEQMLAKLKTFADQDLTDTTKKTEFDSTFSNLLKLIDEQKKKEETKNKTSNSNSDAKQSSPDEEKKVQFKPDSPEKTASLAPQGQTFSVWNSKENKRIVEDQYQYDDPKREAAYYKSLNNIMQQKVDSYKPKFLKLYPDSFDPIDPKVLEKLNEKAKSANQPLYQNSQFRAFSLPKINEKGEITGLLINELEQPMAVPAYWGNEKQTGGSNRNGLPRVLPNETYQQITKNSFSFGIRNGAVRDPNDNITNQDDVKRVIRSDLSYGTAAILDFEKKDDNSYPLKWFFITNAHVAASLRLANDSPKENNQVWGRDEGNYSEKYRQYNTWALSLTKLKKTTPVFAKLPTSLGEDFNKYYDNVEVRVKELEGNLFNNGRDEKYERDSNLVNETPKKPLNVRTIVIGTNALKSSPKDFSDQERYKNMEEVLDFAVVEVNFDNEEQARKMTEDYYNDAKLHYQGREENFLDKNEYEKILPTDFYGFGWPSTTNEGENTLNRYEDPKLFAHRRFNVSPWFNKPESLYFNNNPEDGRWKKGGEFAWSRSYRSFVNLPGITDYFISNPTLTKSYFEIAKLPKGNKASSPYLLSGQGFLIDNFASGGGVSGTSIRDGNQKIYGLQFASDKGASVAMVLALRSYGFDYKGYYGKYNLPAYDIIYGSKNQFKSYFDAMLQLYGENTEKKLKTNLFPNGFSESTRKDVFANKPNVVNLPDDIQKRTYSRVLSSVPDNN